MKIHSQIVFYWQFSSLNIYIMNNKAFPKLNYQRCIKAFFIRRSKGIT